jgi:hypothetical protein
MDSHIKNIKVVGNRRTNLSVDWEKTNGFLKLVVELNKKNKFIPKGVYRFKSHEESDKWILKVLTDQ